MIRDSWALAAMFVAAAVVAVWGPVGLSQDARYITMVIIGTAYLLCHQAER